MNDVGDIYIDHREIPYLVVDCREMANNVYMFHMLNMNTGENHNWIEPHNKQLAPSYWTYLG